MLPKQVKSQIKEANALLQTPPVDTDPAPAEPVAAAPDATPVAPVKPADPPPATPQVSKAEFDKVSQQLRSLQGIHKSIDTERNALRAQVATLNSTVAELTTQVEQFKTVAQNRPKLVTEEDVKEFSPELLDVIRRKASDEFAPVLDELRASVANLTARNAQLEQMVAGQAAQTNQVVHRSFKDAIAELMPDYAVVDNDPEFSNWLQTVNPLTGRTYSADFYAARDARNPVPIVEHYRAFQALSAPPAPAAPPPPAAPVPPIATLASPAPGSGADPAPQATNKKIWTRSDIATFYKDKANGRWAMNPEIARSMEADLFRAQAEGRVAA